MSDFLPLSGAILVTNPKPTDRGDHMSGVFGDLSGLALTNGLVSRSRAARKYASAHGISLANAQAELATAERIPASSLPPDMVGKLNIPADQMVSRRSVIKRQLQDRNAKIAMDLGILSPGSYDASDPNSAQPLGKALRKSGKTLKQFFKEMAASGRAVNLEGGRLADNKVRRVTGKGARKAAAAEFQFVGERMRKSAAAKGLNFNADDFGAYQVAAGPRAGRWVVKSKKDQMPGSGKLITPKGFKKDGTARASYKRGGQTFTNVPVAMEYNAMREALRGQLRADGREEKDVRIGKATRTQLVNMYGEKGLYAILERAGAYGSDGKRTQKRTIEEALGLGYGKPRKDKQAAQRAGLVSFKKGDYAKLSADEQQRRKNKSAATRAANKARGPVDPYEALAKEVISQDNDIRAARARREAQIANYRKGSAKNNPGVFGGLALTNGGVFEDYSGLALTNPYDVAGKQGLGVVDFLKESGVLAVAGGLASGVHLLVVPRIDELVEEHLGETASKIWGHTDYLITGILVGGVAAFGASKIGGKVGDHAATIATGAILAGGVLQFAKFFGMLDASPLFGEDDGGDAEFTEEATSAKNNPFSGLGGLALTNPIGMQNTHVPGHHGSAHHPYAGIVIGQATPSVFSGLGGMDSYGAVGAMGAMGQMGGVALDMQAGIAGEFSAGRGDIVGYAPYAGLAGMESSDSVSGMMADGAMGAMGAEGYGDGMAYSLAPLTNAAGQYGMLNNAYSMADLGDAAYSGADFDVNEGQALVGGPVAFVEKFGMPPVRVTPMGGQVGRASHLAGRPGHRWGWLVKMVGFDNVQKLAVLPPAQRVDILKKMREQAMAAYQNAMASTPAKQAVNIANNSPEFGGNGNGQGAQGVQGAGGYMDQSNYESNDYGAMMFSGADYL